MQILGPDLTESVFSWTEVWVDVHVAKPIPHTKRLQLGITTFFKQSETLAYIEY